MDFLAKVTKHRIKWFALVFSALIACSFFYLQASPAIEARDAPSGIAVFFALIKSSLLFVFLGLSTYKCLSARQSGNNVKAATYMIITIALVSVGVNSMFNSAVIKNALEDQTGTDMSLASNPTFKNGTLFFDEVMVLHERSTDET